MKTYLGIHNGNLLLAYALNTEPSLFKNYTFKDRVNDMVTYIYVLAKLDSFKDWRWKNEYITYAISVTFLLKGEIKYNSTLYTTPMNGKQHHKRKMLN